MYDKEKLFGDFNVDEVLKYEKACVEWYKWKGIDLTFYGNWQKDFGKLLIEMLEPESEVGKAWEVMVDLGCGTALNTRGVDEVGLFKEIHGIDFSEYMIHKLIPEIHKDYEWNANINFHCASITDISMIEDDHADFINCAHTLEHLKNEVELKLVMQEMKRILHPDGKILCIIPCLKSEKIDRSKLNPMHSIMHTALWWSRFFAKYFKSETTAARRALKRTELKPDRNKILTFAETYGWSVFRLVHK
jgi:ubiquinone/menaquinone biosynthesis C-methylase UbiE